MAAITSGMLSIECSLIMYDILDFEIEIQKNNHIMVRITGIIPEEEGVSSLLQKQERIPLVISVTRTEGAQQFFGGFVHTLQISQEGGGYIAVLEGVSSTIVLDQEEKCRSFQDINMTYKELVRAVIADIPEAEVVFHIEDKKISTPIYQYQETDWEFLKRVASQLGTSLLPAGISQRPEIYFGIPQKKWREEKYLRIENIWFDRSYYEFYRNAYQVKKGQFICRDIISYEKWEVGDQLTLENGMEVVVVKARGRLKEGLLTWCYTVALPEVFGTAKYENKKMVGVSLAGTVLETRGENVRIWLEVDREQPTEKAYWYPWRPETGNMMYCMPEVGERIEIMFDDGRGTARAKRCIRRDRTENEEQQDFSMRYFTTVDHKRMYLMSDDMGFIDLKQKVPLKISIDDIMGIHVISSRGINMLAKGGVWLKGKNVSLQAPQEVSIVRRDLANPAVINMCNGFDSIGKFNEVRMKGSGGADFPLLNADTKSYEIGAETEVAAIASTPCMAGKIELERKITGTKVNAVTAG